MYLFFYGVDDLNVGAKGFLRSYSSFPEIEKEYKGMKVLCWGRVHESARYEEACPEDRRPEGMRIKSWATISNALKELGVEACPYRMLKSMGSAKGHSGWTDRAVESIESLKISGRSQKYVTNDHFYRAHSGMRDDEPR